MSKQDKAKHSSKSQPSYKRKPAMRLQSARAVLDALLRLDFPAFVRMCFLTLHPSGSFLDNWHIQALAYHLELVRTGKIRRLIVNMPPRSLKSMVCSVAFAAFLLGHDPKKRIIAVSYGADLSAKLSNDFRILVTSKWFRKLFPSMRLSKIKNTEAEIVTTQHGFRLATSVGGTLTGRGGDIVIIDDPIKPQDAYSDSKRAAANDWFYNTLLSRLDDKHHGAIIVVMQRLHPDDLTGKLLEKSANEWAVLNLAAIAEQDEQIPIGKQAYHSRKKGDVLHPEREPIEVLNKLRAQLGTDIFAAQYQQNPAPISGNMIKREWVRRYDFLPTRTSSTHVLQSYDTASKDGPQNSWSVCTTWLVTEGKYCLVDVLRGKFDYPALKARALDHARKHKPTKILVEDTGVGSALVAELKQAGFPAVEVKAEQNKQARMSVQSAKFESGQVFFPNEAPWLRELEAELFAFPASAHDDQVDSVSQALAQEVKHSIWTEKSLEGYAKMAEGLAWDHYFGRMTGRPW